MRRDRTRKVKLTVAWLPKSKVRVTSTVKLKSGIQLRKGKRILAKGSISSKTTTLKLRQDERQAHRRPDSGSSARRR